MKSVLIWFVLMLFALLIPIYLFSKAKGATAGERYGKAFLLNVKGQIWVFAILVVSAIYEAIEVIAQIPPF